MNAKWNEKSTSQKVLLVSRIIVSIACIVFACLTIFRVWMDGINVAVPLMGVNQVIQSIGEWKERRGSAVFGFCAAAFIFGCSVVVWFVR